MNAVYKETCCCNLTAWGFLNVCVSTVTLAPANYFDPVFQPIADPQLFQHVWLCIAVHVCVYLLLPGALRVLQLAEAVGQGRLDRIAGFGFLQLTAPIFLITCQLSQPVEKENK